MSESTTGEKGSGPLFLFDLRDKLAGPRVHSFYFLDHIVEDSIALGPRCSEQKPAQRRVKIDFYVLLYVVNTIRVRGLGKESGDSSVNSFLAVA